MTAHLVYAIGDKHVGEIGACCGGKLSSGSGATEGIGGIDYGYGMVAICASLLSGEAKLVSVAG